MSIQDQKYEELTALEQLRQDYKQGIMSALVGAGFSLNVSNHYLTWNGLLYDMVFDKYESQIENAYEEYIKKKPTIIGSKSQEDFYFDKVAELINEKGALNLASQYVHEHNNMHESIDTYIEEHIPYAKIGNEGIHLFKNDKEIDKCDVDCLKLHQLLLQCVGFRNYFTTNYDNLLEVSIDKEKRPITVIKRGKDLSNTSADCKIIKIHGSLREDQNDSSGYDGFDGCNDTNYIITQEDYDSYVEKHSAFKTILNTEMLQGVFCLIGFSGTDPNFRNCIDWLLKILGPQDDKQVKFYLIDLSEKEAEPYLKKFYLHNRIKVVRLRDQRIMDQLGFTNSNSEVANECNKEYVTNNDVSFSNKALLEAFFNYLREAHPIFADNHDVLTYDKELSESKCAVFDYRKLWEKGLGILRNKEELSQLAQEIKDARKVARFCKVIFPQESFIDLLMSKEPLTEDKAFLFALAVKDVGQIPSYYVNYHKEDEELNKQPIWIQLIEREKTLHGSMDILSETKEDWAIYEQIQRSLFNLDFAKSKELVCHWDAKDFWQQNKVMRMAAYADHLKEAQTILDKEIIKEKNPSEKLYEVILANFISLNWPQSYSTDEFWRYGLDGQGDMLNSMMSSLRGKKEKPKRRGWIGSTWNVGSNHGDYVKSLRILEFIIDSGIYVSLPGFILFDIANWFIVFQNLYEYFPYPCFFYSIQYNENVVQRRLGEEFAYNVKLQEFNKDILIKSLYAIGSDDTPLSFKSGILNVTAAIYIAVDETIWFDKFKDIVFSLFLQRLHGINDSDELIYNVKFALGSIRNPENIYWAFQQLIARYSMNDSVVSDIIVNNLLIHYIQKEVKINDIFLFPNVLGRKSLFLLNTLNNEGFLSDEFISSICEVIHNIDIQDIPHDRIALFHLFNLAKNDKQSIEKIKQCFLSMNIWHCGVLNDKELGWTEPMYIRLNLLYDKITWTDEEFEIIKDNLIMNVAKYDKAHKSLHQDSFIKGIQVRYLSDMIKFIDGLNSKRHQSLLSTRAIIESLLLDRIQYADNIDLMMSEQSTDVDQAMGNIYEGIVHYGIEKYQEDVDFLIDRAIMKRPVALTRNLKCIKLILAENASQMICLGYIKKLHKLLDVYKDPTSWSVLDLRFAFNYLQFVANTLKQNGVTDEVIDFWIESTFVNRFIVK